MKLFEDNSHSYTEYSAKETDTATELFVFPISFPQQRLWLLDRLAGATVNYNISTVFRLQGKLDIEALEAAINAIVLRHETLRTCFAEQDGVPVQVIQSSLSIPLTVMDLRSYPEQRTASELERLIQENMAVAFDLSRLPLLRAQLLQLDKEEYILLFTFHHIISDGWSMSVFTRELSTLYGAFTQGLPLSLPEPPIQYADYTVWQQEGLQGESMERLLDYWKTRLTNAPTLELPTDRPRPAVQSFRGKTQQFSLSLDLTEGVKTLSRREGVTLFMTLAAAFQVLLHRYSAQDDIVIGTPTAGRSRLELEGLIGFFINTLVLRADLSGNPSFCELLAQERDVALGAYANQDMPFEKLVETLNPERDLSRNPLFQIMFVLQNTPDEALQFNEISAERLQVDTKTTQFDLTFELSETAHGLTGRVEYATDLFEAATISRLIGHFQTLLEGIVAQPEARLSELPLLTESERRQLLLEWNNTVTPFPRDKCIHELFEAQAAKTPQAVALVHEDSQCTYAELNSQANRLAHYLRKLGVKSDTLVAISMDRSIDLVISLLAILKAGGAYVPIDLTYPRERLAFMLDDTQAPLLLTHSSLVSQLPISKAQFVCLDQCWNDINRENTGNPRCNTTSNNLAYIIYTSGSTGVPKGVEICHYNIARLLLNTAYARFDDKQNFLLSAPIAFDASTFELWGGLLHGGRCVIYPERVPTLEGLEQIIKHQQISILWLTASLFNVIIDEKPRILGSVAQILTGGEALSPNHIQRALKLLPDSQLINGYGPTESTTFACCYSIPKTIDPQATSIPIGYPIANTQIYILDRHLQPVPLGVAGELHIGGDGLGRGYLNRPELTAEKFINHPFNNDPQARLYKTGDLARYLPDGAIEFLGRIDLQVKIRGFRIELGEIESVLGQHPQLREVVVDVYEPVPRDKRLVAYAVPEGDSAPSPSELRDMLKTKLPEYMVPSAFVFLDALPITSNGKLDRKALPPPNLNLQNQAAGSIAPRNQMEKLLAEIWGKVLGLDRVGVNDNFFNLGGHSLLAVKVIAEINDLLNTNLPLSAIYQYPTVEELGMLSSGNPQPLSSYSLVPIQTQGSRPPLFAIHTITLKDLPRYLGKDQPLYFLRYGMAAEISNHSVPLPLLEELADHYIKELQQVQPRGPYYLIGFSFGGVIAYEMAGQLRADGHQVDFVGLLDTYLLEEKQLLPLSRIIRNLFRHSPGQLLNQLKSKITNRTTAYKYGADFWPHIYTSAPDEACRRNYQPKSYKGRVTLFQGWESKTTFVSYATPEKAWKEILGDRLEVQQITGDHIDIFNEPHVKVLAEKLILCMDKAINYSDRKRSVPLFEKEGLGEI